MVISILAAALASGALLVTGNLRHFPSKSRRGAELLTPRAPLERLRRQA